MHRTSLLLSASIILLAIAVAFHAVSGRYKVTHMAGLVAMKTDRWTGDIRLCRGSISANAFICGGRPLPAATTP
jgi:hypothetical protein